MQHCGPIAGVAAHGAWVATAGYDNRLILWDAETRAPLARADHDHLVNACDFSEDGRLLVSASSDYSARVWSLPDLRLMAVLTGHDDDVDMARFSPDASLIATCALDRMVRVFAPDGRLVHTLPGHTGNVLSLTWLDNRRFVTSSVDGTLRTWDARDGICLAVTALGMRTDCVAALADGGVLAGDDKGRIALVRPGEPARFVVAHQAGVKALVLTRDGSGLISLGYDRALAVWRRGGDGMPVEVGRGELPHAIWARSAALLPDGRVAVATFGGTYALFDPGTGHWDMEGVGAGSAINAMAGRDGACLAIGDAGTLWHDGEVAGGPGSLCNFLAVTTRRIYTGGHLGELYDAASGQVLYRHHSPLNCAVVFQRGGLPHLAVGAYTGEILIFALVGDLPVLTRCLGPHGNAIKGLAVNGGLLMSACANTDLAWHDIADWREARRIARAHTRIANACCALGGGGFASVGRDRVLRLWLAGRDEAIMTPHSNSVKALAASPCGRFIASGSYGGTVVVYDRAASGFLPMRRLSKSGISALIWSGDGFMAADYAGMIHPVAARSAMALREAA